MTVAIEFNEHDQEIIAMMKPEHQALMQDIGPEHLKSFGKNVKTSNIGKIESWVGSDEELEQVLFWFKDGKFDDPAWQSLKPCCKECEELLPKAKQHLADLKKLAIKNQKVNDLTLFSAFNPGLLFSGVAPAVKVRDDQFCGVEFRLIGSVPGVTDSLTIMPVDGGYEVGFGASVDGKLDGVKVYCGDNYSLLQLCGLIERRLGKIGAEVSVKDEKGNEAQYDVRELRKTGANSVTMGWGEFLTLYTSKKAATVEEALQTADQLATFFYDRFGLERECVNNGRAFGNFGVLRDENFDQFIEKPAAGKKGFVMLTATLVCRRCRREMKAFHELAKRFPHIQFCLVNLNSPLSKFYERVFGDMGGGNADDFRKNAAGVTPFTIIYSPNADGKLEYREYYGTEKAEACPELEHQIELIEKYIKK